MANEEEMALMTGADSAVVAAEQVERRIYTVRGQNVLLDSDLAELYGVETRILNQTVRRNNSRFPADFMFRLTLEEAESLRFQMALLHNC